MALSIKTNAIINAILHFLNQCGTLFSIFTLVILEKSSFKPFLMSHDEKNEGFA